MFSWANKQLEKLSETLAPPPSTPTHRFLTALRVSDEIAALAVLNDQLEPLDLYGSLNHRGMSALHAAASHGNLAIVKELIVSRGVCVDLLDSQGWSALHHAAAPTSNVAPQTALALTKFLVEECGAAILARNAQGQTAYDEALFQAVRGYLLPKQLQLETQECLNDGGRGLMPGIDMGGIKLQYSHVPPPPTMTMHEASSYAAVTNREQYLSTDASAALMKPPPIRASTSYAVQQPPVVSTFLQSETTAESSFPATDTGTTEQQKSPFDTLTHAHTSLQPKQPALQPLPKSQSTPSATPSSTNATRSGYALRGGNANAASILNESTFVGKKLYKPDGFHSSSNDKELQRKYGHVENDFEKNRKLAVPPPPVSAGASLSTGPTAIIDDGLTNGGPPVSSGFNPYSVANRNMGYIAGSAKARYPTYCPLSNSVSAPPSLTGGVDRSRAHHPVPPVPTYTTFPSVPTSSQVSSHGGSTNSPLTAQTLQLSDDRQQTYPYPNAYESFLSNTNETYQQNTSDGDVRSNPPDTYNQSNHVNALSATVTLETNTSLTQGYQEQSQSTHNFHDMHTPSPSEHLHHAISGNVPHTDNHSPRDPNFPSDSLDAQDLFTSPPMDTISLTHEKVDDGLTGEMESHSSATAFFASPLSNKFHESNSSSLNYLSSARVDTTFEPHLVGGNIIPKENALSNSATCFSPKKHLSSSQPFSNRNHNTVLNVTPSNALSNIPDANNFFGSISVSEDVMINDQTQSQKDATKISEEQITKHSNEEGLLTDIVDAQVITQSQTVPYGPHHLKSITSPSHPTSGDTVANMFATPHAESSKKHFFTTDGNSGMPSLPYECLDAHSTFASPLIDSTEVEKAASVPEHFSTLHPLTDTTNDSVTANDTDSSVNAFKNEALPLSAGCDNGSVKDNFESTVTATLSQEQLVNEAVVNTFCEGSASNSFLNSNDASQFFGVVPSRNNDSKNDPDPLSDMGKAEKGSSEARQEQTKGNMPSSEGDIVVTNVEAVPPAAACRKSFGGLPPPPILGKVTKSLTFSHTSLSTPISSSLPPPPVARSKLTGVLAPK